jgi:hypothetical protein
MFIVFFLIFGFPVFDDDLLSLCSQVNRFASMERLIKFLDIISSDILLAACHEVSFHDIGESVDQYIEWLLIGIIMSFFVWLHRFLECMDDIRWLARIAEDE